RILERPQSRRRAFGLGDLEMVDAQQHGDHCADVPLVVDDENAWHRALQDRDGAEPTTARSEFCECRALFRRSVKAWLPAPASLRPPDQLARKGVGVDSRKTLGRSWACLG